MCREHVWQSWEASRKVLARRAGRSRCPCRSWGWSRWEAPSAGPVSLLSAVWWEAFRCVFCVSLLWHAQVFENVPNCLLETVLFLFPVAAVTNDHRLGALDGANPFSLTVWRSDVWDPGVGRSGSFWGLSPRLADGGLLPVSLQHFLLVCFSLRVQLSPFNKDTVILNESLPWWPGFNLITSSNKVMIWGPGGEDLTMSSWEEGEMWEAWKWVVLSWSGVKGGGWDSRWPGRTLGAGPGLIGPHGVCFRFLRNHLQ